MKRYMAWLLFALVAFVAEAQTAVPKRYVLTSANGGAYTNGGTSWDDAKNDIQEAINELSLFLRNNPEVPYGEIYVGAGEYVPYETTETDADGILYTSFKIQEGIRLYGGFSADGKKYTLDASGNKLSSSQWQQSPADRIMANGKTYAENIQEDEHYEKSEDMVALWEFDRHSLTRLNGYHGVDAPASFLNWNSQQQVYSEVFPANSYHVVWFATAGFYDSESPENQQRARRLARQSVVDGFTITGGNASNDDTSSRRHSSYGGGVYLVDNGVLRNCIVTGNASRLRGGGVYCDGGGTVEHCLISQNQSRGIGLTDGYGGGVCMDGFGSVLQSVVERNSSRIGGGIAIVYDREKMPQSAPGEENYHNAYSASAAGCLVVNNTAQFEGGGVMMFGGGTLNRLTIARNHCAGSLVTYGSKNYGRSGGLYIERGGTVYNSVIWGNTTRANGTVQYSAAVEAGYGVQPAMSFCAVSSHDNANWLGTQKHSVLSLMEENRRPESGRSSRLLYPEFVNPGDLKNGVAGVECADGYVTSIAGIRDLIDCWQPLSYTDLVARGVALDDVLTMRYYDEYEPQGGMLLARLNEDILGNHLSPLTCLGAIVARTMTIQPSTTIAALENGIASRQVETIFVDPEYNRALVNLNPGAVDDMDSSHGDSWENPIVYPGDALAYAREHGHGKIMQILIKEGDAAMGNRRSNVNRDLVNQDNLVRMRDLTLDLSANVRIYGSYYGTLTGTESSLSERDPLNTPTRVSGALASQLTYVSNASHLVTIADAEEVVVDGLMLEHGNSTADANMRRPYAPADSQGAGILIKNSTGVTLRNLHIANCTSSASGTTSGQGAAIYISRGSVVTAENLVVFNNTAIPHAGTPAVIFAEEGSTMTLNHSLVRTNVGGIEISEGANFTLRHSALHANLSEPASSFQEIAQGSEKVLTITGILSAQSADNLIDSGRTKEYCTPLLTYMESADNYNFPAFVNATMNVGAQASGYVTRYGGDVNFTPLNMNPMVNRVPSETSTDLLGETRNHGGRADIGPIENLNLPAEGTVLYVRDADGNDSDSGASWDDALKTISAALQKAGEANSSVTQIWVAAGTYYETLTMVEGVNVYGGFVASGNPGIELGAERNISNKDEKYKTIVDASRAHQSWTSNTLKAQARPLTQPTQFTSVSTKANPTVWEGFIFQNGKVRCLQNSGNTPQDASGGGVYLLENGKIKNCLVQNNMVINNVLQQQSGTYLSGGGGVYCNKGQIESCIIEGNKIGCSDVNSENSGATKIAVAGAGAFLLQADLVNTVIAKNVGGPKNRDGSFTGAGYTTNILGVGVYVVQACTFTNCTIVDNYGEASSPVAPGVWDESAKNNQGGSFYYNCIITGNVAKGTTDENFHQLSAGLTANSQCKNIFFCYITVADIEQISNYQYNLHAASVGTFTDSGMENISPLAVHGTPAADGSYTITWNGQTYTYKSGNGGYFKAESGTGSEGTSQEARCNSVDAFYAFCSALSPVDLTTYELKDQSLCINKANETYITMADIEEDANGVNRILDCRPDIGAYEYDGSINITPAIVAEEGRTLYVYYVTETGSGNAGAGAVENAACAGKLQKVLDAAGRYLYDNPDREVVVRLAEYSGYMPTNELRYDDYGRSVVAAGIERPRAWSIIVPRGVRLEGGYGDDFVSDQRDILNKKTVLTGGYMVDGVEVAPYHVVSFTNVVYDTNHEPRMDSNGNVQLLGNQSVIGRAVVDGFFISGGNADGAESTSASFNADTFRADIDNYRPDNYGGAAIVPSYAHIRNCVVEENAASGNGGGLFLLPQSLVSGSIIRQNSASGIGGGIFVYEPAEQEMDAYLDWMIANAEAVESSNNWVNPGTQLELPEVADSRLHFANVFTSTIVENESTSGGGGVYFTSNLKMNSSVVWGNQSPANANISGQFIPEPMEGELLGAWRYPLQYCAVEGLRAAGYNNFSVASDAQRGVRWDNSADEYYYLKKYSVLVSSGMSMAHYDELLKHDYYYPTLSDTDISGRKLMEQAANGYIEVGARAFGGVSFNDPSAEDGSLLMRRLYVAMPEQVEPSIADLMNAQTVNEYYRQQGSSMAFPMKRLEEALHYIREYRKQQFAAYHRAGATDAEKEQALENASKTFEIFVSGGTFYPSRTVKGVYTNTRGNTYLVPEGVAIYGGIPAEHRRHCAETDASRSIVITADGFDNFTLQGASTSDILAERPRYDVNANGVLEGWGLESQTILSGELESIPGQGNLFHVIMANAAEEYVGLLPKAVSVTEGEWNGSAYKEHGMPIILDGLQITGGEAIGYNMDVNSVHTYYKGGAICVDGNWYTQRGSDGSLSDLHHGYQQNDLTTRRLVGYRNIPVIIRNSLITNNRASMGGAVFSNGSLQIYSSQFAQNQAFRSEDESVPDAEGKATSRVQYNAYGGALNAASLLAAVNTIFANNSADTSEGGRGGAIVLGEHAQMQMLNCNVVNNTASAYPAIYAFSPNKGYADISTASGKDNPHKIVNSILWGNINTVESSDDENYGLVINTVDESNQLGESPVETLWFSAYEYGRWHEALSSRDDNDVFRKLPYMMNNASQTDMFIPLLFHNGYNALTEDEKEGVQLQDGIPVDRYNFNILLESENRAVGGPNFVTPSAYPGADGYQPNADWMLGRINNLVDRGWTYLEQHFDKSGNVFFKNPDTGDFDGSGVYVDLAKILNGGGIPNPTTGIDGYNVMPVGEEMPYMYYNESVALDNNEDRLAMLRVSLDPNPSHNQTFIDIGAYEYQHIKLNPGRAGEVDYIWVAQNEGNAGIPDGSTFDRATSDLQRAIETLLASRNNRHKEIRLIAGQYMPIYTITKNLAFTISTSYMDDKAQIPALEPGQSHPEEGYGIKSFTIRGGYGDQLEGQYDIDRYKARISMGERAGIDPVFMCHSFIIEDARQRHTLSDGTVLTNQKRSVVPITIEGIEFSNPYAVYHIDEELRTEMQEDGGIMDEERLNGGAALFYKPQRLSDAELADNPGMEPYLSSPIGDNGKPLPKLTVKNCIFSHNGPDEDVENAKKVPAVTIAKGGGEALIYNSLFHHNSGSPFYAVATTVLNSTFAQNGAPVKYGYNVHLDPDSRMLNSILWRNGNASESDQNNEIDGNVPAENIADNAIYALSSLLGANGDDAYGNSSLCWENDNVLEGPNFEDPEAGNYRVLPGVKITRKADHRYYSKYVFGDADKSIESYQTGFEENNSILDPREGQENMHNVDFLRYRDLGGTPRLFDGGMERGAYESLTSLERVAYVIASKSSEGSGITWEDAYAGNQIQNAINASAVYSFLNGDISSYIFVRGSEIPLPGELTMHSGVNMYGSLQPDFIEMSQRDNRNLDADTRHIEQYVMRVKNAPERALASPNVVTSKVRAIIAREPEMTGLVDGFVITSDVPYEAPAIEVSAEVKAFALTNSIVTGVNNPAGVVADIQGGGLLYDLLIYGNSVASGSPHILLSDKAYMLNNTLVAENPEAAVSSANPANVLNHIGAIPASDIFFGSTPLSAELFADFPAVLYQLREQTQSLNGGDGQAPMALPKELREYVDYATDRDLLGNPRMLLNGKIDLGCYQTWNVNGDITATTSRSLYGGNYYPHSGSVIYINSDGRLILDNSNAKGFIGTNRIAPAYLLLFEGGGLYGQGNSIALRYASIDMDASKRYALHSLPFDFSAYRDGLLTVNGVDAFDVDLYSYDGARRSAYDYDFKGSDSDCWISVDYSDTIDANSGFLVDFGDAQESRRVRFTAFGAQSTDFIYTEGPGLLDNPDEYIEEKIVTLTQYDDKVSASGGADFTHLYNMGWNLTGVPYMVSNYATGVSADNANVHAVHPMDAPHVIYTLNEAMGYDARQSWMPDTELSAGRGFFTQTAVNDDSETLIFAMPQVVERTAVIGAPALVMNGQSMIVYPDEETGSLKYLYGNDGLSMIPISGESPLLYAVGESGSAMSLLSAAPYDTDIPLGVRAAEGNSKVQFALQDVESWLAYGGDEIAVWLLDSNTGSMTNLMTEAYTATIENDASQTGRFTLRIGTAGIPGLSQQSRPYYVKSRDASIIVSGLEGNERIDIYTPSGINVISAVAQESNWRHSITPGEIYIVRIGAFSTKIVGR